LTAEDESSVERLGEHSKRVRFAGVDSWGALRVYAEQELIRASRCIQGMVTIPCNPMIRSGDIVDYNGHEWHVERAQHNFSDWSSHLTMWRQPKGYEIHGVFFGSPQSAEEAIVKVIRTATGRVDNAVEATVVERLDARTYRVRVAGRDEEIEIRSDHVLYGDLRVGATILVGRGTR
jgi:hypothetical protein